MTSREIDALKALRFNWAEVPSDVWRASPFHVETLHPHTRQIFLGGLEEADGTSEASPIGLVIQGQRGSGKTHMLGWARAKVQQRGGYFFLVSLLDARSFWASMVVSLLDGLSHDGENGGESQLKALLDRLSSLVGVQRIIRRTVVGNMALSRAVLDTFIEALRRFDRDLGRNVQDTARALVLLASDDLETQDIGHAYLTSTPEEEPGERARWGIRRGEKTQQEIVGDLSRLLALTGPSVVAVDQIDTLIAQSSMSTAHDAAPNRPETLMIEQVAGGLMGLREVTRRTLTVVSCIPQTWTLVTKVATDTVHDRFRQAVHLKTIPDAATGRALVERRFQARFREIGFEPPYPTWPVRPSAFERAPDFTPRQLLIKIDGHVQACLADGEVRELESLARTATARQAPAVTAEPEVPAEDLAALDARFAELREAAEVAAALAPATEDAAMPALLSAGLSAWIIEQGEAGRVFGQDPPPSAKPPLHARLRRSLDESTEDEMHWGFRAIASEHPVAALTRLRNASVAAGLSAEVPKRRLFVLRGTEWSKGPRTREAVTAFEEAGGRVLAASTEDLKILSALRSLLDERPPRLRAWLVARRPTGDVKLLAETLGDAWTAPGGSGERPGATGSGGRPGTTAPDVRPDEAVPGERPGADTPDIANGTNGADTTDSANDPDGERPGADPADRRAAKAVPGAETAQNAPDGEPGHTDDGEGPEAPGRVEPPAEQAVPAPPSPPSPPAASRTASRTPSAGQASGAGHGPSVSLGRALIGGESVDVALESLRKHVAVFAGSGSGKTVLIRGLVERCALQGVSAIVLDPNNDLARLGDPWPEAPASWGPGDAARAGEYLANTDVVIWTPQRGMGRPLSFRPLPDFTSVADDPDEFEEAVEIAVASIAPRAKLDAKTRKAHLGQAVLREALRHYGRQGATSLRGLIDLLASLPEGVSGLTDAEKIAAELAQTLTAAMVNDLMFGGDGTPVDPGILLTPPEGKRARVSVISLTGLPSDSRRQSFVNQLQMALFAWIKRNPAGDRPLGGLFVMDEAQTFAPSGAMTACTQSTLALASQARKYGLGLVFATQAPKGLHNRIPGNATTQFFGLLNSPTHISAAQEMARAKGGDVADIGRLTPGRFYAAVEGRPFVKVRVPLCLSHHPRDPLTTEEVVERARRSLRTERAGPAEQDGQTEQPERTGRAEQTEQPEQTGRAEQNGQTEQTGQPEQAGQVTPDVESGPARRAEPAGPSEQGGGPGRAEGAGRAEGTEDDPAR